MADFRKDQAELEALALRRDIYKQAIAFIHAPQTKDFAKALVRRIEAKRDSYITQYDSASPENAILFARCQEARKVCSDILLDFDADTCKKAIEQLDIDIKNIHNRMEKKKESERLDTGFNSL